MTAQESALRALLQAQALEEEGCAFYRQASQEAADPKTRQALADLARDEEDHLRMISYQLEAFRRGQGWSSQPAVPAPAMDLKAPLFPKGQDLKRALRQDTTDLQALSFGLDIETRSYALYTQAAAESAVPEARAMYAFLASAERAHFETLMMRYEALAGPVGWQR